MLKRIFLTPLLLFVLLDMASAQTQFYKLTPLPLSDLSRFKTPTKNWQIVGDVSGSFDSPALKSQKGTGVLLNDFDEKARFKPETNLFTALEHGDIYLSLDFMMPKGSNSGIYLMGRYEIQLMDSWGVKIPHVQDCGSIYERWDEARPEGKKGYEGHPARSNASLAPGLWQHLEIEFNRPRFDENKKKIAPARFVKVVLNGVVIHENILVTGPTRAATFQDEVAKGPLMIQGDHGPVAFRNIQYALLDDFNIKLSDVQYEYYEGSFQGYKLTPDALVRKGSAEAIDAKLADNPNKLGLVFTGTLDIKEKSEYQFILKKVGKAKLNLDGEDIASEDEWFADAQASRTLDVGKHTLVLTYVKGSSWGPAGVGVFIGKANARPQPLHLENSLPAIPPTPLISVSAGLEPELIRSFMYYKGKKKTHVISVGDPAGIHYAYDLDQAALLQCWRGDFLNVTEMWYERGEPQVASPMGAPVMLNGKCPLAIVGDNNATLPDTLNDRKDLIYKGYRLDEKRYPKFKYQYGSITFEDSFQPDANGQGIARTLTVSQFPQGQAAIVRFAEGSQIREVSDHLYVVDEAYYVRVPATGKTKPSIRINGNKKELVLEWGAPLSTSLTYTLIW
ncbi:MAG TPA: DUF1080 domain-containing protein [Chryseolinea sp.]